MNDIEAKKLIAAIGAMFPASPLDDLTLSAHVRGLASVDARDSMAIFDLVYQRCKFFPTGSELLSMARECATVRAKAVEVARDHEIESRFRLESGITPAQEASNVERLKAMTRDYLHRLNATKAARAGKLPDDWVRTEDAPPAVDRTHCRACRGRDPRCPYCEGRGVVCPTCGGAHVLRRSGESGERPLYVGCSDCTDWARQKEHGWDDHGYPVFERDRFRERDAVHAWRNGRKAAA